jgi:hypothetical protein
MMVFVIAGVSLMAVVDVVEDLYGKKHVRVALLTWPGVSCPALRGGASLPAGLRALSFGS